MICPNCHKEISTSGAFCPHCGGRLSQKPSSHEPDRTEPVQEKGKKKTGLVIGIIAAVALLACIALVVVLLLNKKDDDPVVDDDPETFSSHTEKTKEDPAEEYAAAQELLEKGEYAKAKEAMDALGDYEDAQNLAAYAGARLLLEEEKYAQAKEAFSALGDFKDAQELAGQCQNEITYADAMAKKAAGDFEAASALFAQIPGVKDADDQAADCKTQLTHQQITEALGKEDWKTALDLLEGEDGKSYPDYENAKKSCQGPINYDKAKKAMEDKLYYTAYQLFSEMGNYKDAANLAAACQRPMPETSELSRSSEYRRQTCRLNLSNKLYGGYNVYFRVYDASNNAFVSSVFIRSGKDTVIYLPEGTFIFKAAYGKSPWFGEKEMFGDNAIYKYLLTTQPLTNRGRWGTFFYVFEDELAGSTITREDF